MKMELTYRREDIINLIVADTKKRFGRDIVDVTVQVNMAVYDKKDCNKIVTALPNDVIEHYTAIADEFSKYKKEC